MIQQMLFWLIKQLTQVTLLCRTSLSFQSSNEWSRNHRWFDLLLYLPHL